MSYNLPYIAKCAGPTISDATKDLLREYAMTGDEIGARKECKYTFMDFAEFVHQKVGDDIWQSLKFPTSAIYKAVSEYKTDKHYHVEYIIESNGAQGAGRKWLVKWEGYDDTHNTWEPLENFVNPAITIAFDSYEEGDGEKINHISIDILKHLSRGRERDTDKIHMLKSKLGKRDDMIADLKSQINRLKKDYNEVAEMFNF